MAPRAQAEMAQTLAPTPSPPLQCGRIIPCTGHQITSKAELEEMAAELEPVMAQTNQGPGAAEAEGVGLFFCSLRESKTTILYRRMVEMEGRENLLRRATAVVVVAAQEEGAELY